MTLTYTPAMRRRLRKAQAELVLGQPLHRPKRLIDRRTVTRVRVDYLDGRVLRVVR